MKPGTIYSVTYFTNNRSHILYSIQKCANSPSTLFFLLGYLWRMELRFLRYKREGTIYCAQVLYWVVGGCGEERRKEEECHWPVFTFLNAFRSSYTVESRQL